MVIVLSSFLPLLVLTIILSIVFRKGNKRLLWLLVLLLFVISSYSLKAIGAILIYALPKTAIVEGINFPYLPVINGIIILLLSFPLIFLCRKNKLPPIEEPTSKRWLWFGLSIFTLFVAQCAFVISTYFPRVLGTNVPCPQVGVYANVVITIIGSFLLYYSSRLNTPTRPNLLRWLAFLFTMVISFFSLGFMMILIYAMPPDAKTTYPFLAGILSFNLVMLSLVNVGIAKDYVPKLKISS
jgi:hypothetical protein